MYQPLSPLDSISSALYGQQNSRASLAQSAISLGATFIQRQEFEKAATEFKRASAYDPELVEPHTYLARTYQYMGRNDDAITSYRKALEISLKTDPTSKDARTDLANACISVKRYAEAEVELKRVVGADATAVGAVATLGHLYRATGRLDEAEAQFAKATRLAPRDAAAHYSLGLVYNDQQRYTEAIDQFQQAVALRPDYAVAHADLAYSFIGLGDTDSATLQVKQLSNLNTDESVKLATEVALSMYTPKIAYADVGASTFNPVLGTGTPLALLDPKLAAPGASANFTMIFHFNQAMDASSVQNSQNWLISRASGGAGGTYDNGVSLTPGREVGILPFPISVSYDSLTHDATVTFRITQNAAGDGVMDPRHWVFQFLGRDAGGNPMDPAGDQWDGDALAGF
jgi:tetratricopeptide (TPR) repeat protein